MWWSWKEVDLVEIKAFLGVIINMAMNPKPELGDYFSTDWIDVLKRKILADFSEPSGQSPLNWPCPRYFDTFWQSAKCSALFGQKI